MAEEASNPKPLAASTPAQGPKPSPAPAPSPSSKPVPSTAPAAKPAPSIAPAAKAAPAAKPAPERKPSSTPAKTEAKPKASSEESEGPRAPKRATLDGEERRLLVLRRSIDRRRPIFGRQAANRYYRIGRWGSWRKPRGQQSKQRRHYGYRSMVVSIGFRTPAKVRGLTPSGFLPSVVHNAHDLESLDPKREAAVIAHGVGVRKRLVLEEQARKLGLHVLNPFLKEEGEQ